MNGPHEGGEPETASRPGKAATGPEKWRTQRDGRHASYPGGRLLGCGTRPAPPDRRGPGLHRRVVDTRASFTEQLAAFRPDIILSDFHLPGFSGELPSRCSGTMPADTVHHLVRRARGRSSRRLIKKEPRTNPEGPAARLALPSSGLAEAEQRAYLAQLEDQLFAAQRLASLGQLAAAEEAVSLTARSSPPPPAATAADPRRDASRCHAAG